MSKKFPFLKILAQDRINDLTPLELLSQVNAYKYRAMTPWFALGLISLIGASYHDRLKYLLLVSFLGYLFILRKFKIGYIPSSLYEKNRAMKLRQNTEFDDSIMFDGPFVPCNGEIVEFNQNDDFVNFKIKKSFFDAADFRYCVDNQEQTSDIDFQSDEISIRVESGKLILLNDNHTPMAGRLLGIIPGNAIISISIKQNKEEWELNSGRKCFAGITKIG